MMRHLTSTCFAAARRRSLLTASAAVLLLLGGATRGLAFPPGFLWGTAISGFQSDMGGGPASVDPGSDWWVWSHDADNIASGRVSGDLPEAGPDFYDLFATDIRLAQRRLRANTFRLSLEWSRIFPSSTAGVDASGGITAAVLAQLDALADQAAVAHYREVLTAIRAAGMEPFVTVNHFSLPLWIHDPIAARNAFAGRNPEDPPPTGFPGGWIDAATIPEFAKYAAYVGWKLGDLVDLWAPLNEAVVVAVSGYVNIPGIVAANFPPGAFSYTGAITTIFNEAQANAAAYDALKAWDTTDADGDGTAASVGLVHNMVAFHPQRPGNTDDETGTTHADYIFNRIFLDAAVHGDTDVNVNGTIDSGEHHPELVGKADFIGVNYYLRAQVLGIGVSISSTIPILDFAPTSSYATPQDPSAPPCPSTCTDVGWEIYPQGLREVLATAGSYGLPVYVTENGIADADDHLRKSFVVQHLTVLEQAITDGVADVRGYYHWSLTDNFEWASGYFPKFGLFRYDATTQKRHMRKSARIFSRVVRRNSVPAKLSARYPL